MDVNTNDAARAVMRSVDLTDLRELIGRPGPFLTLVVPTPSALDDAEHRLDIRWRNARRELDGRWPDERIADLDELIAGIEHDAGAAIAIVQPTDGPALVESLLEPVRRMAVHVDPLPRLATVIESRQRTLPHVVVQADKVGADIVAFDGGSVVAEDAVEGDTEHIHRGRFGGWSHRRFQQRAENTWERNADDVAAAVGALAADLDPVLIAVAGPVRAQSMIVDALAETHGDVVVPLESGDADGVADEVVRLLSDRVARAQRSVAERLRSGLAQGTAAGADATLPALVEGRVATLLVDDDDGDEPTVNALDAPDGARTVDVAVRAALDSGADIVVMPNVAAMGGPIASLLRW